MVKKYGKQGLEVVGVTAEADDKKTLGFVEQTDWQATVIVENGNKTMNAYKFTGYPSAALVDGSGKLVWSGHPSGLRDKTIEQHLGSVRMRAASGLTVDVDLPKKFSSTAKKLSKGKLGDGWKALEKAAKNQSLDGETREMLEAAIAQVETFASEQFSLVTTASEEGRYFDALEKCKLIEKHFKGVEISKKAKAHAAEIKANKELKNEIEAGKRIAKAEKAYNAGKLKKALSTLKTVTDGRLSETTEAKRASKLAGEWQAGN